MAILRIGEYDSLGAVPAYFHLKSTFRQEHWRFAPAAMPDLDRALDRDEVDVGLVSPLLLASAPSDFLVLPGLGYAAARHTRDMFLFSDMLLDDMDEMTFSVPGECSASYMLQLVTGRYLQFQNQFITGWGNAEAFLLVGDHALRERLLARYAYVYDLGDLWRHYTGKPMVYLLWAVKKETFRRRREEVRDFHRTLQRGLELMRSDWAVTAAKLKGYDWVRSPQTITQLWTSVNYELSPPHYEGLDKFFDDCAEDGIIEEPPELEYAEV